MTTTLSRLEAAESLPRAFLTPDDLAHLTGKRQKVKQIEQLRRMGVPFYTNASGHPIVAHAVIEGRKPPVVQQAWRPAVLGS